MPAALGLPLMVSLADSVCVERRPEGRTLLSFAFFFARDAQTSYGLSDDIPELGSAEEWGTEAEQARELLLFRTHELAEELAAANEELRAQNDELVATEEELRGRYDELDDLRARLEDALGFSRALNALGSRLSSTLDFDEMLHHLLTEGLPAVGADAGVVEVRDGESWTVSHAGGSDRVHAGETVVPEQLGVEALAASRLSSFVVEQGSGPPEAVRSLERLGVQQMLIVPLVLRGVLTGAVLFGRDSGSPPFEEQHVVFADALAAAAGLALENSRLYADVQRFADHQELESRLNNSLAETAMLAASQLNQEHILRILVSETMDAGHADSVTLFRRDFDGWIVQYMAGKALSTGVRETEGLDPADAEWVTREKVPLAKNHELADDSGSASIFTVLVPLTADSEVRWLLELGYRREPEFTAIHQEWARRLSFTMSLALQNARLYQDQRVLLRRLQEALLSPPQKVRGVAIGHSYRSATADVDVGGDFYDVYESRRRADGHHHRRCLRQGAGRSLSGLAHQARTASLSQRGRRRGGRGGESEHTGAARLSPDELCYPVLRRARSPRRDSALRLGRAPAGVHTAARRGDRGSLEGDLHDRRHLPARSVS